MANELTYSQHSVVSSHEAQAKTLPVRRLLPLRVLRSLGFHALERSAALKRRFALRGMGFRGDASMLGLRP